MSDIGSQNPFTPPRALVEDRVDHHAEMVVATRGSRFLAVLVDAVAPGLLIVVALAAVAIPAYQQYLARAKGIPATPASFGPVAVLIAAAVGLAVAAFYIYSAVLVYRYGQTFGKRVMGIRVVRTDGSRVTFGRFIGLRWLPLFVLGLVPVLRYVVGLVDSLLIFRESRLCLHDNIADTQVVTAATSEAATLAGSSGAHLRTIDF